MAEARIDREQQTQSTREGSSSSQNQKLISPTRDQQVRRRSSVDYSNPFDLMNRITEQLFGPLMPPSLRSLARSAEDVWTPPIEVSERDGKLVVRTDLPGMNKDDVRVEVRDNNLIIEGERKQERKEDR